MNNCKTYRTSLQLLSRKGKGLVLLLLFFSTYTIYADEYIKEIYLDPINSFDEVPVEIIVKGYLRFEADVIITDSEAAYINVEELFRKLGILCEADHTGNSLKGFIENESIRYLIDFNTKTITKGDRVIKSNNGIVKELGTIYIETSVLNEAFGLNMIFNFRSLSIKLDANFELPLVKKARLEKIRENVSILQSKNEVEIDTVIGRNYHIFKGGALDWSISSSQAEGQKIDNRFSLGLGSELLFGEAKVAFNYYDQTKFDRRQLYYNWRWVDNDNSYIKQAQVGKIGSQTISYLGAPLVGASFNNSPNTVRKATGTYTISEYTEPNWTVELYINDVLVDYTQSDASGLYLFNVPIVYGYTTLKLKFYGPLGEERIEEKIMNTPYTFMPTGVLEYNVSGGVLENDDNSNFGRGEVNYGVNRFVTIGAGTEYLSSIANNPLIPFANIAFQPFSKLVINMEYAHNVSLTGLLNYNLGRSAFLEIDYSKYVEGQEATLNRANEERKIRLSLPFKMNRISATTKISFNQLLYDAFNFNQLDALFSTRYKNYSANASVASNWINDKDPFITSTLVLSSRMRSGVTIRPSLQYNVTDKKMMRIRAEVEKRISKMSFSASFERNIQYGTNNLFFSFKYDLPFARTSFSSAYNNDLLSFSESAQGSLAFGGGEVRAGYNSAIGKGGIICYPFLDLNHNGKFDKGEQKVLLNNVKVIGGKAIISQKDSLVRISDLNAFINYTIEFSEADLDNISWKFSNKVYQILVDPNQYKKVYVPIISMGEISGTVYMKKENELTGQGRITVEIYDEKGTKVAETLTESDGYYSYLGLKSGAYTIRVDEQQLEKLGYLSTPQVNTAVIEVLVDGDIKYGLNFTLESLADITNLSDNEKSSELKLGKEELVAENTNLNSQKLPVENEIAYTIEIGNYKEPVTLKALFNLSPVFYEVLPNGNIRYVYGNYSTLEEAANAKNGLILRGVLGATIVSYKNNEADNWIEFGSSKEIKNQQKPVLFDATAIDPEFTKITELKGAYYSVQIGAFKNRISVKQLLNLTPIYFEVLPNSVVRYFSGTYLFKNDARIVKNKIVNKGIKDAYIVAYADGKKIAVQKLDKIIKASDTLKGKIYGTLKISNKFSDIDLSKIAVQLLSNDGMIVKEIFTDSNGNYRFVGIEQGAYSIRLNEQQLQKIGCSAIILEENVVIKNNEAESKVQKIDFELNSTKNK